MTHESATEFPPQLRGLLLEVTGATGLHDVEVVQSLWSGYGQVLRCRLEGGPRQSVIVKHVRWPNSQDHPRGWNSDISHQRKVRSYEVETHWYQRYASRCGTGCPVPQCLAVETLGDGVLMVLEDLNTGGFPILRTRVTDIEVKTCLSWLASFHATFMGRPPEGLWEVGTYWHLATRPEEFKVLDEGPLKRAAGELDRRLNESAFLTFVHGDAKLANFCFSKDGRRVAAVDFQYIGGGCGMKDVAYFIGSCLDENHSEQQEDDLLDFYFEHLENALDRAGNRLDFPALESDWRELYPVAWTDFYRFLKGWSPDHWKLHRYSERLAREVLAQL